MNKVAQKPTTSKPSTSKPAAQKPGSQKPLTPSTSKPEVPADTKPTSGGTKEITGTGNSSSKSRVYERNMAIISSPNSTQAEIYKALENIANNPDVKETDLVNAQHAMESKSRRFTLLSNILESQDNTFKAMINNFK